MHILGEFRRTGRLIQGNSAHREARPFVKAQVLHPQIQPNRSIMFIVDTASDRTVICPRDQRLLGIRQNHFPTTRDIETISGLRTFGFLTHCRLRFVALDDVWDLRGELDIHFYQSRSPTRRERFLSRIGLIPKPLSESGPRYSILGRDALLEFGMGFHIPELLLLTAATQPFLNAIKDLQN